MIRIGNPVSRGRNSVTICADSAAAVRELIKRGVSAMKAMGAIAGFNDYSTVDGIEITRLARLDRKYSELANMDYEQMLACASNSVLRS